MRRFGLWRGFRSLCTTLRMVGLIISSRSLILSSICVQVAMQEVTICMKISIPMLATYSSIHCHNNIALVAGSGFGWHASLSFWGLVEAIWCGADALRWVPLRLLGHGFQGSAHVTLHQKSHCCCGWCRWLAVGGYLGEGHWGHYHGVLRAWEAYPVCR